jgi:hypothetical protein
MPRRKGARDLRPRTRRPITRNYSATLWTTGMCEQWSGLRRKYIVDLLLTGKVPFLRLGPGRDDTMPDGSIRRRPCAKYMVYSTPFKAYIESLGTTSQQLQRSA